MDHLERTPTAQLDFDRKMTFYGLTRSGPIDVGVDPFDDDTPIEAQCDLENPGVCESCT